MGQCCLQLWFSVVMALPFVRPDLAQFSAYTPHPGSGEASPQPLDLLDTNECAYDLPAPLKQQLAEAGQTAIAANRYPDGSHQSLKQAIAEYVSEALPQPITPQHISVGNGSDELIRSLLIATCSGGQGTVLVAQPTFSMYRITAQTLGIPVVTVDRDPATFAIDLTAAQAAIATPVPGQPPVRVVFMVHPNSPTANPLTAAELAWLRQLPEDVLVVVDEAYFEFCGHTTAAEVHQRPNWVVMRTFSKAFRLAAYRMGYCIAHPDLVAVLEKVRLPYNLPSLSQQAALLALQYRAELLAVVDEVKAQRTQLVAGIRDQTPLQVWPSAANFLYVRPVAEGEALRDALQHWFTQLKAQGTLIRLTGEGLRITVGSPAENQRTLTHLQAVEAPSVPVSV